MKAYLTSLILVFIMPLFVFSQEENRSLIYNYKGQLRIDTSLTISQKQFKAWSMAESNILTHLSKAIEYPPLAKESGIKGVVIVSIECDTFEIKNIIPLTNYGGGLENAAVQGIEKIKKKILMEFKLTQNIIRDMPILHPGTYYIPIDFNFIDLTKYMKNNHTIPILETKAPLISRSAGFCIGTDKVKDN